MFALERGVHLHDLENGGREKAHGGAGQNLVSREADWPPQRLPEQVGEIVQRSVAVGFYGKSGVRVREQEGWLETPKGEKREAPDEPGW